ncbi:MAG TPA: pilus assembly protein PilM, partial [Dehalococcoidales bacterium]|nr:pilus assembly protein PilM [Dehalococcoidales bacterium]
MKVTLNIGSRDFRLVSQRADQSLQHHTLDVPAGIVKDGLITNIPAAAALLREYFQKHGLSSKEVSVCLTGLSFVYRILTLPVIKGIKLKTTIERAAQKEINLPLDELYLDWQIISQNKT